MGYSPRDAGQRAADIRHAIDYGTKLIFLLVGVGLFRAEVLRIISLPRELNNELYLVLLIATALLTLGWVFVSNKEFEIMCDFLDPIEYQMPRAIFVGMAIATALTVLLYTARNPLWFGISYSGYMLLSVFGWRRVKSEMDRAIRGSRDKLLSESEKRREIYEGALDILYSYYVRQPNLSRVWTGLALAVVGLMFSVFGSILDRAVLNTIAYIIFSLSILGLEGGLAFYWRYRLYAQVRPFEAAKHDLEHPKHHNKTRRIHSDSEDSYGSKDRSQ